MRWFLKSLVVLVSAFLVWTAYQVWPDWGEPAVQLAQADAVWITRWKQGNPGVLIDDPGKVAFLVDSIRLRPGTPGACGYTWRILFLSKGRLLEDAYVVDECHHNFSTSFGCFQINRRFRKALQPYLERLEDASDCDYVHDIQIDAGISEVEAVLQSRGRGNRAFLFSEFGQRFPSVVLKRHYVETLPETDDRATLSVFEEASHQRARKDFQERLGHLHGNALMDRLGEISMPMRSFGAGKVEVDLLATVFFKPHTQKEAIQAVLPAGLEVDEWFLPRTFPIQVVTKDKATGE